MGLRLYLLLNIAMNIRLNEIDKKRQKERKDKWLYKVDEFSDKEKFFALDMFPYPSGAGLHVWHPKWYIATDIVARKKILEWYNVLHPMWRDAFGLPAENYALKNKVHPSKSTTNNVTRYKSQLEWIGFSYDRSREINTTDPKFYKWTQWAFLKMYEYYYDDKKDKALPISELKLKVESWELKIPDNMTKEEFVDGYRLAYVDYKPIIRCPKCKTGLAQEDLEDGKCERCDSDVEMKPMRQWVLRITKYANRLLKDMDLLDEWPNSIKEMQKNWIWKSKWTEFDLEIDGINSKKISVYTTRVDTVFGMAFVALAPEHPLVGEITSDEFEEEVSKYVEVAKKKSELQRTDLNKDKSGVFCGAYAVNPFNGKKVPIYIADYVVASYGSGAVMAVPAHDERDHEFAMKYGIKFEDVVAPVYNLQKRQNDEKNITGVVVALFDPKIQKYACLEMGSPLIDTGNKNNEKKYILVTWGRNGDEDFADTAKREAQEEWWIVDIQRVLRLGDCIYSRYHHSRKKDNRFSQVNPYLIVTDSQKVQEQKLEDHENDFELVRMSANEMMKKFEKTIPTALHIHDVFHRAVNMAIVENLDIENDIKKWPAKVYTQKGVLCDSGEFDWIESDDAILKMNEWLEKKWLWKEKTQYKLQERVFSRQRYWGEPIPMIHVEKEDIYLWSTCEYVTDEKGGTIPLFVSVEWEVAFRENEETKKRNIVNCLIKHPSEDKYLGLKWKNVSWRSWVSGGIEDGEDIVEAWIREIKEETWYQNLKFVKFLPKTQAKTYRPHKWSNIHITSNYMLFELIDEERKAIDPEADKQHDVLRIYENEMRDFLNIRDIVYTWDNYILKNIDYKEKIVAMNYEDLPLTLPNIEYYEPTGTEEWPLANIDEWINVDLPDGGKWKRESNTMPQWAWSSWYRLRYMDPNNDDALVDKDKEKYRGQVDIYVGGTEHATRHLIYARFWYKFLYDIGVVSNQEPFKKLRNVGMILAEDGRKMSKRRWNVINPDDIIAEFGADTMRVYEMFMGPFEHEATRSTAGLKGARKFLEKVIKLSESCIDFDKISPNDRNPSTSSGWLSLLHKTIKKVSEDIDEFKFNTAISQMMIFVNNVKEIDSENFEKFVLLLAPFAPHLAEEFWSQLWHSESIFKADWPKYNPELIVEEKINLAVQFNGKMRGTIETSPDAEENEVVDLVKVDEKLMKYWLGEVRKIIYIKGKILNIIVN